RGDLNLRANGHIGLGTARGSVRGAVPAESLVRYRGLRGARRACAVVARAHRHGILGDIDMQSEEPETSGYLAEFVRRQLHCLARHVVDVLRSHVSSPCLTSVDIEPLCLAAVVAVATAFFRPHSLERKSAFW